MTWRYAIVTLAMAVTSCHSSCGTSSTERASEMTPVRTIVDLNNARLAEIFVSVRERPLMPIDDARRVVTDFRQTGPFTALPAAGKQEIWFGKAYNLLPSGSSTESWIFLRIRSGPVDPKQQRKANVAPEVVLPYAVYTNVLSTDDIEEESDAIELFYAGMRGQPVHPKNQALPYIRKAPAVGGEWPLIKTGGPSLAVAAPRPRWLRQQDRRLLLIDLAADASLEPPFKVTGSYAQLWRVE